MILTDELCDKLCAAAREKSREIGIDISFAVSDENGLPRVYRRYGEALVLSVTLVPGKAYTAAVAQCKTKDVAAPRRAPLSWPFRQTIPGSPWSPAGIRFLRAARLPGGSASAAEPRSRTAKLRNTSSPSLKSWRVKPAAAYRGRPALCACANAAPLPFPCGFPPLPARFDA